MEDVLLFTLILIGTFAYSFALFKFKKVIGKNDINTIKITLGTIVISFVLGLILLFSLISMR